jgi:hypothetical protein
MAVSSCVDDAFEARLGPTRARVIDHPLYARITDERSVLEFMQVHVFAVWDFMSLVKGLQQRLTSTSVPWSPTPHPVERRFINQVVLDEESDLDGCGQARSHFEMYVEAMAAAGADIAPISRFTAALLAGRSVEGALDRVSACDAVRRFVCGTLEFATGDRCALAAAFAYGRELVIPDMFRVLIGQLSDSDPNRFGPFAYYLDRHIETDDEVHGPIARQLVARLVGRDQKALQRALDAAERALELRLLLWDEVVRRIDSVPARNRIVLSVSGASLSGAVSYGSVSAGL